MQAVRQAESSSRRERKRGEEYTWSKPRKAATCHKTASPSDMRPSMAAREASRKTSASTRVPEGGGEREEHNVERGQRKR